MKRTPIGPQSFVEALQRQTAKRTARAPLKCRQPMSRGTKRMKSRGKPDPNSVRGLENVLDDLVRKVLPLDESVCFTDGRRGTPADPLTVSHLFGRAQRPTRFDVHLEGNNHLMHASCNSQHNDDKSIYRDKYIERFGVEAYEDLDRRAHSNRTFDYLELYRLIEQREAMLK